MAMTNRRGGGLREDLESLLGDFRPFRNDWDNDSTYAMSEAPSDLMPLMPKPMAEPFMELAPKPLAPKPLVNPWAPSPSTNMMALAPKPLAPSNSGLGGASASTYKLPPAPSSMASRLRPRNGGSWGSRLANASWRDPNAD